VEPVEITHNMELIGAFLTGVVGPILYLLINKFYQDHRERGRDKVKETVEQTCIVEKELFEAREEFGADRVWIAQFHNGGNFYPTGKSIQKFTVFYEDNSPGIGKIAHTLNNIPCSLYPKALSRLMTKQGIFISNFEYNDLDLYGLQPLSQTTGTKSQYILPLFSLDDKFIGMIGVDYVVEDYEMNKNDWEHFQIYGGRIAGFLSNYLKK